MFPLFFSVCAEKYSVQAAHFHAWVSEFFSQMSPKTAKKSHQCRLTYIQSPLSRPKSRAQRLDSHQMHIMHDIQNHCVAFGNRCAAFSCHVCSLEGTLLSTSAEVTRQQKRQKWKAEKKPEREISSASRRDSCNPLSEQQGSRWKWSCQCRTGRRRLRGWAPPPSDSRGSSGPPSPLQQQRCQHEYTTCSK